MRVESRYRATSEATSRERADALIAWLREHAERRVNSRLIDERRVVSPHIVLEWGNRGLFGIQVEERFGGLALRSRDVARVLEQAAALDLALGTFLLVSLFPGVRPIAAFGSDALKDRVLRDLATGRVLAGYAQTEPDAGTHFAAMQARAVQQPGGGWRLSADKVWIGNASWAGVLSAVAYETDASGKRRGLIALAVDTHARGVLPGAEIQSLGMRGVVQNEIAFRDVEVGEDCRLGEPGGGLDVGVDSMSWSRFAIAATCIGAMKRSLQLMQRFASRRSIATGPLASHPFARGVMSEAIYRTEAMSALLYAVADALDEGAGAPVEILAVCKIAASEFAWATVDELVQLLGSRGYDEANHVPQLLRDARVTRIFEGATEPLIAFVGAQALNMRSELWEFLGDRLEGEAEVGRLADALDAMRARARADGAAVERATQHASAGWAALWALVSAAAARRAKSKELAIVDGGALRAWANVHFTNALSRASHGTGEIPLLDPAALEKAAESYAHSIGDVEQSLPGERREFDPLLRRTPPR